MKFGYINNNDCTIVKKQKEILANMGVLEKNIFIENGNSKNGSYPYLKTLLLVIRKDDVLLMFEINNLGRNKSESKKIKEFILNDIGGTVKVL